MSVELMIIVGFLLHLVGDYLFQNDWMAQNKTESNSVALLHAFIYSLPFGLLMYLSPYNAPAQIYAYNIILWSHFFIDRHRLAAYWIKLVNWNWKSKNFGYKEDKPLWMSVWLMIIIDNIFHILINTICIYFSY